MRLKRKIRLKIGTFFVASACAALLVLSSQAMSAQDSKAQTSGTESGAQTGTQMDKGSSKMMKSPDARFAMKAAQGGMAEVQLGQLAAQQASNADVKAFGQHMVDDHSKANDQLKSVAQGENMTLPTTLDAKDQALMSKLQGLSGADFDKTYVKAMVKDHQEDIKEFQKEADSGKDPQIKNFASQTLPILQEHLSKIQSIQSSMAGGGSAAGK
jgi:putative membrane protein